ncbi:MAG: 30S ribosomal protein S18 [Candidatus Nomurabacteria bacterium GW2011_GWD2_36_14]|nr:MAG: 30S ribosomal protein S18 [Candidatus Nomurabacteria bacterium GW2011_GWE2_36_115]KKP94312.1 MAG: 30S ribosomal protein S18 [Candidatus Nomurabacteria bacterium GW2011_GWF2_36_126]KKP96861.1 MAG: 30S ribosomal protein S18 [Candidatus Nomurabacteria bacterium GW2011_GWD2_36_14]KKP99535.1 MAG: 30S ribosomal protein S18 [Candidatus Nomurabacteria bacterium GW2011_GWF2_36_19]KKQ05530.1 MAG: 30S ribosomal protein S18 [Candidatus Nomurabacteria bacterium GW2011_GWF1_36_47]KKQ09786.1 MAG: 30S
MSLLFASHYSLITNMKQDYFSSNNIKHIDYKDVELLRRFITPSARMQSRKRTDVTAKNQRKLAIAIKRARFMGLLPYIAK